jgi:hypothetical protein
MASMGNAQRGALGGLAKLGEGARTTSDLSRVGGGLSRGANEGKKLNAAPWSDTWPAAGATLDLDFANNRGFVRGVGQGGVMDAITFTRASTGWYVGEDGLLQEADNGEPRFDWASTEQVAQRNLLRYTEQFDNAYWSKSNVAVTENSAIAPNLIQTANFLQENTANGLHALNNDIVGSRFPVISGVSYTISVYVKYVARQYIQITFSSNGFGALQYTTYDLINGTITGNSSSIANIEQLNDGWFRLIYTATATSTVSNSSLFFVLSNVATGRAPTYTGDGESGIFIWGAQLEVGDTATEYIEVGSVVPSTTPLRTNPTSNGILIEEARTNRLLWNRDATQTEWVKTNITAVKDQTGIDGVANAASSLTATDDNGTCIQTITLGAGNRTGSVYLKRLTGTGLIQVTLDGSTYSTVELSDTEWYRIVLSGSVTNPTVGIKIAADGDAVAMDYGQVEDGLFESSPILTTTATATRAVDSASVSNFTNKYWMNQEYGTINIEVSFITNNNTNANFIFLSIDNGSNNFFRLSRSDSGGAYLRLDWAYRTTLYGTINQNIATSLTGNQQLSGTSINKIAVNMQPNNYIFSLQNENVNFKTQSRFPNTVLTKETGTLSFGSMSWIKRLVYFPKTTNDNQLEAITT